MAESDAIPERIPEYVIRTLAVIRESGLTSMSDRRTVTMLAEQMGDLRAASWLNAFHYRYGEALRATGTRLAETRDKW